MDNSPLDLEQMLRDVEDYLIIIEEIIDRNDTDNTEMFYLRNIVGWLENILDGIEKIWYNEPD